MTLIATTLLERAVLGLVSAKPSSGYDIRKLFQDTPLGMYSDSPGSIYPTLRRLERRGLLVGRAAQGKRRRRLLRITPRGRRVLLSWLTSPVTYDEVARGRGEVELKLAFLSDHTNAIGVRAFMRQLAAQLEEHHKRLTIAEAQLRNQLPLSGHIALRLGRATTRSRAAWCARTARNLLHR